MSPLPLTSSAGVRWSFREARPRGAWLPATVPGCVHTDLRAAGRIPDPFFGTNELDLHWIEERDWEYRAAFNVPASLLAEEVVELCADGLDTAATVFLNGRRVAAADNMFISHRWDVKPLLRRSRNELRLRFRSALDYLRRTRTDFSPPREFNDPVGNCVRIRKQQCQFGWDWGPRFVTAGIWRELRLEGWSGNRLTHLRIAQHHASNGTATVEVNPQQARAAPPLLCTATLSFAGHKVAEATGTDGPLRLEVSTPRLWWPAGQGEQPLYDLVVTAHDPSGRPAGRLHRRIGLRTVRLDRSADVWGESFRFVVNDRPVFAKGANWIPAHAFVAGLDRARYARDLRAAVAANMNMIRVWGGGIYESEDFYDLCDELGLLVWQDFMFACTLYPADPAFLDSVRTEAEQQVARLHHRAALALWCGNNELVQINLPALGEGTAYRAGYERLFHETLPAAVAAQDGATAYWPTSQWRGSFENSHASGEARGDTHFWDVWHARKPAKEYERYAFRFVSEFGMQSYSSPQTNATFCPPHDTNVFGPAMENHQKNSAGNQIILDYVSRRYRFPRDQESLIWLSQLNQACCMQVAVEHFRRLMPRCMGALYWQLNDCWPVASWSSIEFTGRWKQLHYAARRFFAPALVSAAVPGDETPTIGNYRHSSVRHVHLYTVYDAPRPATGRLRWDLYHVDGRRLEHGEKSVRLQPGTSVKRRTLDLARPIATHGRDRLYLRLALDLDGACGSEQTVLLSPPRFVDLPRARARVTLRRVSPTELDLTALAPAWLHAFTFEFGEALFTATDNGFDLYPDEPRTVRVTFAAPITLATARAALVHRSLVDSYA
jgi:beta-mannosidase